ncbi:carbonic anhydrase 2-like [Liolophura sinensis]|uniref:carbonic anhydrase 2-like n=1 Tax=Liolophura sinensis TaxID=3198878 RepID=UPI0031589462
MGSWGYGSEDGPHTWSKSFPAAAGKRQSPIDILTSSCTYDEELASKPLTINYQTEKDLTLGNCGYSLKAGVKAESYLSGGPLKHKYRLEQFHWHWGSANNKGSEHTVNGQMYAAELHLVHWNTELYSGFGEAATSDNGLAVLGVLIKAGKECPGFKTLAEAMEKVKFKGQSSTISSFSPQCLLPGNTSKYWTYDGSLTTPPCAESVSWIVFQECVEMSEAQLKTLRSLVCEDCPNAQQHNMVDNNRPTLPVGDRKVRASFK